MLREGAEMGSCAEGFKFMIIIIIYLNDNIIAPLILPLTSDPLAQIKMAATK